MTFLRRILGATPPRELVAAADLEYVRVSSGTPMSEEMTLLLALVIFDGYTLFPNERERRQTFGPAPGSTSGHSERD